MNLAGKPDLDTLLKSWPAPLMGETEADEDRAWDEHADVLIKNALEKKEAASSDALDALLASPTLPPVPGESSAEGNVVHFAGEKKKMDQEKDPPGGETPMPPVSMVDTPMPPVSMVDTPMPPAERRRPSLKEIAARAQASNRPSTPGARPSTPGTPPPSSVAARTPSVTPLPRAVEAGKDDSGVINLNVVRASATAQQVAAAEKAKPGQEGLFDDDQTVESPVDPAQKPAVAKPPKVAVVAAKRSNTGPIVGA